MKGFGYDYSGYFRAGEYTWEIWYNGNRLRTRKFRLSEQRSVMAINVNGVSFDMVRVEGGTFTMGCTYEQYGDCYSDESPSHSVTLSNFYIGRFEVTQDLWYAVMGYNPSYFSGDVNLPVENVSWNDCQRFISRLNQLTGKRFRLPTEAEWEYAARGGNRSNNYKYSGSNYVGDVAWYDNNADSRTHVVGSKSSNELGLYDMSGNVYEWCQDYYSSSAYSSYSQTNPTGPSSGEYRVYRGGCWYYSQKGVRIPYRNELSPSSSNNQGGFRLAMDL